MKTIVNFLKNLMQRGFREGFDIIFIIPKKEQSKHILKGQKPNEEPVYRALLFSSGGPLGGLNNMSSQLTSGLSR